MAIAVDIDIPGMTAEQYGGFMDQLQSDLAAAPGFLVHTAGPEDRGWHVSEVWRSEEDFTRFASEKLAPMAAAAGMTLPQPRVEPLHRVVSASEARRAPAPGGPSALHLGKDEGRAVRLGPLQILIKEDGSGTRGAISVAEFRGKGFRIPPHVHTEHDETIYCLEGELGVSLAGETFTATAGTSFTVPINVPHSVWNETDQEARFLNVIAPARYLDYFEEMAAAATDRLPAPEVMKAVMGRYGLQPVK